MWTPFQALQIFVVCYALPLFSLKWNLPSLITDVALNNPLEALLVGFALPMVVCIISPPNSLFRWAAIPVISSIMISYLQTAGAYIPNKTLIAMSTGPTTLVLMQSIDHLVLQRLHLMSDGKETAYKPGTDAPVFNNKSQRVTLRQRKQLDIYALKWGWDAVFNFRAVGTPRAVKNMPRFSYSNPDYVPSRRIFLLKRGASFVVAFIVLDFLTSQPPPDLNLFAIEKAGQFSGFAHLNREDLIARFLSTAAFWVSLRLTIALIYNGFSLIPVSLMIQEPEQWPPYFGSVASAYSIRTFWA